MQKSLKTTAKAPTRIDLAGGTIDLWPLYCLLEKKATVNIAVSMFATATVETSSDKSCHIKSLDRGYDHIFPSIREALAVHELPFIVPFLQMFAPFLQDKGIHITLNATSPKGAGLGGSSSLGIALLKALSTHLSSPLTDGHLIRAVSDMEAYLIKAPTGLQDYYAAVRGGANILEYPYGQVNAETIDQAKLATISEWLILCDSRVSRASAINNWHVFKSAFDGDLKLLSKLGEIGDLATSCAHALRAGDLKQMLYTSKQEWLIRESLFPNIHTEETRKIANAAEGAGAYLSRVCGAGGGGVMAIFSPPEHRHAVCEAATHAGGNILAAEATACGLSVIQHD